MTGDRGSRLAIVDAVRGAAVLGMIAFHAAWDLRYYGWTTLDPALSPGWRLFGDTVAACFLCLSGLGLVLAQSRGLGPGGALRRLGRVLVAALAVTGATGLVLPERIVVFGILHCIVVTNAIALTLLRSPLAVVAALCALAAVLPTLAGQSLPDGLWWMGLSARVPETLDYRPVLPWLAPVLLGVLAGRLGAAGSIARLAPPVGFVRPFAAVGRRSLAVYLIHQPILLGCLAVANLVSGHSAFGPPEASSFLAQCEAQCVAAGADVETCRSACQCALTATTLGPGSPKGHSPAPADLVTDGPALLAAACAPSRAKDRMPP